jgi:hypothetical protein
VKSGVENNLPKAIWNENYEERGGIDIVKIEVENK